MSEFTVTPGALEAYVGVLSTGGHEVSLDLAFLNTARHYVDNYVPIPSESSLLYSMVGDANTEVLSTLQADMPAIGLPTTTWPRPGTLSTTWRRWNATSPTR